MLRGDSKGNFDVFIQGVGPVGCIAALLASRLGLSVCMVDAQAEHAYRGNAHYLNAYTLEILDLCGINVADLLAIKTSGDYAYTMAIGITLRDMICYKNLHDDPNVRQRYLNTGRYQGSANIRMSVLYPALLQAVRQVGVEIVWHSTADVIDFEKRIIHCRNISGVENKRIIHTKVLLGCDGIKSAIRKKFFKQPDTQQHQNFINIRIGANLNDLGIKPALLYWVLDPVFPGCYVAHELDGEHNFQIPVFSIKAQEKLLEKKVALKYLKRVYGDDSFQFDLLNINAWKLDTYCMPQMQNEWIFLVGDSAHSFTPAGGLGFNAGVADAANLIWRIGACLDNLTSSNVISYQSERVWVNSQLLQQSLANYRNFKSMATAVGLPVFLAEKSPTLIDAVAAAKGPFAVLISDIFNNAIKSSLKVPGLNSLLLKRINKSLSFNMSHFDGMGSHIGFTVENPSQFADANFDINSPDGYKESLTAGRLFLSNAVIAEKTSSNIRDFFHYRRWSLLVFNEKIHSILMQVEFSELEIFHVALKDNSDPSLIANIEIILVRPDLVIAYAGIATENILTDIQDYFSQRL